MREILFRGMPLVDEKWLDSMGVGLDEYMSDFLTSAPYKDGFVYGQLIKDRRDCIIAGGISEANEVYISFDYWVDVAPETVGQYIGLKDKNGTKIFEGDILESSTTCPLLVSIKEGCAWVSFNAKGKAYIQPFRGEVIDDENMVVVGNKWNNPEILEV